MVYRWVQLQQDEADEQIDRSHPKAQTVGKKMAPHQLAWLFLQVEAECPDRFIGKGRNICLLTHV